MAKEETLNSRLLGRGYRIESCVKKEDTEKIAFFLLNVARGYFTNYRVIPAELALEGCEWRTADRDSHIIYTKISKKHSNYKTRNELSVRLTTTEMRHESTGEDNHHLPLENL